MLLTPQQVTELFSLMDNYLLFFLAENVGLDFLTDADKATLAAHGIDLNNIAENQSYITQAFKFGILSDALGHAKVKNMDYGKFKKFIDSGSFVPLSPVEQKSVEHLKLRAYSDIKGLGNTIQAGTGQLLIEADKKQRQQYEKDIQDSAVAAVEGRESLHWLTSEMGHKTKDWARDFRRISDFVLHEAFDHGRAAHIQRDFGADALCYKDVYGGACKHCIKAYLTAGIGSQPVLFKLSQLRANGSNVGRKSADWLPVLGPHHPWCRCTIHRLPEGYVWDEQQQDFVMGEYQLKVPHAADVKVTIGDQVHYV
jgi:hypothetical protein